MKRLLLASVSALLALVAICVQAQGSLTVEPRGDTTRGKALAETICAACHNADGNSTLPVNPKLAGQHYNYLLKQLRDFQSSDGKPPVRNNPIMAGMTATLSDAQLQELAAWFASQTMHGGTPRSKEALALGQKLYRFGDLNKGLPACAACHGPSGAGVPIQYPRLGGQFADYTEAQLKTFRTSERRNDQAGMMRAIAGRMSDVEISAVADYIASLH